MLWDKAMKSNLCMSHGLLNNVAHQGPVLPVGHAPSCPWVQTRNTGVSSEGSVVLLTAARCRCALSSSSTATACRTTGTQKRTGLCCSGHRKKRRRVECGKSIKEGYLHTCMSTSREPRASAMPRSSNIWAYQWMRVSCARHQSRARRGTYLGFAV